MKNANKIAISALLGIPIVLWLLCPRVIDHSFKRIPAHLYYNRNVLEGVLTIIAAACIIVLAAPFIPSNRVTVELGLSRPSNSGVPE